MGLTVAPDGQNGKVANRGQKDRTVDNPEHADERLLEPREAEELTGMSARSLRRYNVLGILGAKKTPGGHRRYRESEVRSLLAETEQAVA